jgi:hypothetical protein
MTVIEPAADVNWRLPFARGDIAECDQLCAVRSDVGSRHDGSLEDVVLVDRLAVGHCAGQAHDFDSEGQG